MGKTLTALIEQDYEGPMHVAVCVNGDTTGTAALVEMHRSLWTGCRSLQVVEIPRASKPAALNTADRLLSCENIRIYLDADTVLSPNAVKAFVRVLCCDEPRVVGPKKKLQLGSSCLVGFFASALLQLPWIQGEINGSGVYAVNASGRKRWEEFPELTADDSFAVWQFAQHERVIVDDCSSEIRFPLDIWSLLRVQRRWIDGKRQLVTSRHCPPFGPAWSYSQRVKVMLSSPKVLFAAIIVRILRWSCVAISKSADVGAWSTNR